MDSEALLTFVTIQRCGGFSAAADELRRSQPAISRRIALLEEELGGPLFERGSGGVRLSQLGQTLLPWAIRALAAIDDAQRAVSELKELDAGPLDLAAVGTLAGPFLTAVLRRFSVEAPDAVLGLRTATSRQVSELVRTGQATIGLRYFEDRTGDLHCRPLMRERLVVVCAPEHPLAGTRVDRLADMARERWFAFPRHAEGGEVVAETLFAQFLTRGVSDLQWSAIDSLTAQKRLVEAGFGIALLPESSIEEEVRLRSLVTVDVADLDAFNPVFAITRRDGYLSRAAQRLLDLLTNPAFPLR